MVHISEIRRRIAKNSASADTESKPGGGWLFDNGGVREYDMQLGNLLGGSIKSYAERKMEENGHLSVMDLMGHGQVLREIPLTAGLAVALEDNRDTALKELDAKRNIDLIAGDILSKKTWEKISKWVKQHTTDGMDLVLLRPLAGYDTLPDVPETLYSLTSRVWNLISPNEGKFVIEEPGIFLTESQKYLRSWSQALKSEGVDFWRLRDGMIFIKTSLSPRVLPKIDIKS